MREGVGKQQLLAGPREQSELPLGVIPPPHPVPDFGDASTGVADRLLEPGGLGVE